MTGSKIGSTPLLHHSRVSSTPLHRSWFGGWIEDCCYVAWFDLISISYNLALTWLFCAVTLVGLALFSSHLFGLISFHILFLTWFDLISYGCDFCGNLAVTWFWFDRITLNLEIERVANNPLHLTTFVCV